MSYVVVAMEEGHPLKSFERKFEAYARGRWEGVDYIDGPCSWHNDYCTFDLVGCTLADLGERVDTWEWKWKEL